MSSSTTTLKPTRQRATKQSSNFDREESPIPSDSDNTILEESYESCAEAELATSPKRANSTTNNINATKQYKREDVLTYINSLRKINEDDAISNPFAYSANIIEQALNAIQIPVKTVVKEQRQFAEDKLSKAIRYLRQKSKDHLSKPKTTATIQCNCSKNNNNSKHINNNNNSQIDSDFSKKILSEINTLKQHIKEIAEDKVRNPISYASALGNPISNPRPNLAKPVVPKKLGKIPVNYSMIVRSDKLKTTDEIRSKITQSKIYPKAKAAPKGIYNLGKDKVKLNFASTEDRDKILNQIKQLPDLKAEIVKKKDPLIILKWIPSWIPKEDIIKDYLIPQNEKISNLIPDLSETEFKVRFKIRPKKLRSKDNKSLDQEPYHLVIETSSRIYRSLMKIKDISIDTKICQAQPFLPFKQCFKCCGFGHIAKHCDKLSKPPKPRCAYCAGSHAYQDCKDKKDPKKKDKICCFRCNEQHKYDKTWKYSHMATSPICPFVQEAKSKLGNNVDW